MTNAKLTEFGKKLLPEAQNMALGLATVTDFLRRAGAELYPDVPWQKWTAAQWDAIYARADELWVEEKEG